ncbi:MAG: hypothetical protein NT013_17530 [Planctomycetia bacterium]|nr:hypothetical protein [Planctomycetia bacterium]
MEDARQVEQIAGRGISQLREGVEKAAEAVLGDETEALRRAREQLNDLSKELNREIARNAPGEASQLQQEAQGQEERRGGKEKNGESISSASKLVANESQKGNQQAGQQPDRKQPSGKQTSKEKPQEQQPSQPSGGKQPEGQEPGKKEPGQGQSNQAQEDQPQTGPQPQRGQPNPSSDSTQSGQQKTGQSPNGKPRSGQRGEHGPQRLTDSSQPGGSQQSQGGTNREAAPIAGNDFREWSDRLRDVEEMVDDPELRAEAARIRDQARAIRAEMKRHSKDPNWSLVRVNVSEPLAELTNRIAEELLRRNSKQTLVPLDHDPVPPKYSEKTRRYYERLGSGK